ncbi:MAG: hypothetical protein IJW54_03260 [Clostridia bacterium]|nr:hypothetical protein [Clostridia bacterium]
MVLCSFFKNIRSEYSLFIRLAATLSVSCLVLTMISPLLEYIEKISMNTPVSRYIPILFKALGISLLIHITSDVCYDAGETSLAEKVILFGKIEILALSLPLIKELFNIATGLLE